MTRAFTDAVCLSLALAAASCGDHRISAASFVAGAGAMAVVTVDVSDTCAVSDAGRATARGVWVDGQYAHELLVFAGADAPAVTTLVGPLGAGRHAVDVRPSAFWKPSPCIRPAAVMVSVADKGDARHTMLRHAPVIELRADTIGEQTDLPLYSYVEDGSAEGLRTLRYTVVFSHEDGGTPTRALLARWGRTTDIEGLYDVTLRDGSVVREEFQGPDHEIRAFDGRRRGRAPVLLVATLNNMVTDRGRGMAWVRPVPEAVDLARATRESTMDTRPWSWRVMVHELEREGRIVADAPVDDRWVKRAPHPRDHVYLEARLTLDHGVVAAWVRDREGNRVWSDYERASLRIDRDGWVRTSVAFAQDPATIIDVGWACLPAPDDPVKGTCTIEATRTFVFGAEGVPGADLVGAASATLRVGEEMVLPRR